MNRDEMASHVQYLLEEYWDEIPKPELQKIVNFVEKKTKEFVIRDEALARMDISRDRLVVRKMVDLAKVKERILEMRKK